MGTARLCVSSTLATHGDVCCSVILCKEKFKSTFMLSSLLTACSPCSRCDTAKKKSRAPENHTTSCSILAFPYLSSPTATLAHKGHRGPQGASQADASPSDHLHSNARVSISCSQCPRDQSAFHTKLVLCRNKPLPVSDTTDHDENFVCFNEQNSRYIYMGIYNQNHP